MVEEDQAAENTYIKQNQLMEEMINNIEKEFKEEKLNYVQTEILNQ